MTKINTQALGHAMRNRCPYCGRGPLYKKYLTLEKACSACDTSYQQLDSADGPAYFVSFVLCMIAGIVSLVIEMRGGAEFWQHALIWFIIIFTFTALLLKPTKSIIIGLQVRYGAEEALGTLDDNPDSHKE